MCKERPFWAKKNEEKWLQLEFNINFLKQTKKEFKNLHCEYCGKKNLKVYGWCEKVDTKDVATVDHFYPKSKYDNLKKITKIKNIRMSERNKCGCENTKDENGYCDGSHMNIVKENTDKK
mgnify:CR=1 FL=1